MTSGPQPASSAALLRGPEMGALLERLAADADLVILNAPPLLPVADAQALLDHPQLDAYLIVARVNFTKRDEARKVRQLLERRELSGVGLVINGVRDLAGGDYYHAPTKGRPTRSARRRRRRAVAASRRPTDGRVPSEELAPNEGDHIVRREPAPGPQRAE